MGTPPGPTQAFALGDGSGDGVEARYLSGDEDIARLVLEMAKECQPQAGQDAGFSPDQRVVIAVHPDLTLLRAASGGDRGQEALGVYKAGVIHLLSPRAWIFESAPEQLEQSCRAQSPLIHELSHFALDHATGGD
ncbi:MAG TPA: hypothetical protein DCM14_06660 [Clostridiales bacterium UBA8153]|nr:hypothetical protein [Clostridiales bacterium UBA8153]